MHKPMEMESGLPPPPYGSAPPTYGTAPPQYHPTASPEPLDHSYPPRSKPSSSMMMFGVGNLVLRSLTLVFLLIGLVVLAVDSVPLSVGTTLHAVDVISYRYTISVAVTGIVYTLVQIGFAIARLIMGAQKGRIMRTVDFYGDKLISNTYPILKSYLDFFASKEMSNFIDDVTKGAEGLKINVRIVGI